MANLTYIPPQPQTSDSELVIDRKTAVNISRIADAITSTGLGSGGLRLRAITVGSDFDFLPTDFARFVDASAGPVIGTLPLATGSGQLYLATKIDVTDNVVTIAAQGADLIDGSVSLSLTEQFTDCFLQDGALGYWHSILGTGL